MVNLKEHFRMLALLALALPMTFAACSDDENPSDDPDTPVQIEEGVFVYNTGNEGYSIDGSLSFIDVQTDIVTNNAFLSANGRSLGSTVQDGVVLDDSLYIAVSASNTIEVVNKNTLVSVFQIRPEEAQGSSPRDIVTDGEYVYVSMQTGHVSRIDPTTNTIDKTVKVGPNPEEMAISGGYLYVTNSDGNNWQAGYADGFSVSKISLSTFEEEKKISVGMNPSKIVADASGNLIVLCMGDYSEVNPASIWKIDSSDEASEMGIQATIMAVRGNSLYTINAPFGATEVSYIVYNTVTGAVENAKFVSTPVDSAAGLAVHPESGNIYITSYTLVGGFASYNTPSYVNAYTSDGTLTGTYEVGIGAVYMSFLD